MLGFVEASFNPPAIAALLKITAQERSIAPLATFVEVFTKAGVYGADKILKGGAENLDHVIDVLLDDAYYNKLRQQFIELVPWSAASRVQQSLPDAHKLEVPALIADSVTLALRLEYELFRAQWRRVSQPEGEPSKGLSPSTETLFGASVPPQFRAAEIAYRIGEVCAVALSSGKFATSYRLAVLLVEKWIHGTRAVLGFFLPVLYNIDPRFPLLEAQLLPRSYVANLAAITAEFQEAQYGLAIALDEVERTGTGFPVRGALTVIRGEPARLGAHLRRWHRH